MTFEVQHTDNASDARTGIITTDHGQIKTPIFMPVGTAGTVKGVHFSELREQVNARLFLATHIICICVPDLTYCAKPEVFMASMDGNVPS